MRALSLLFSFLSTSAYFLSSVILYLALFYPCIIIIIIIYIITTETGVVTSATATQGQGGEDDVNKVLFIASSTTRPLFLSTRAQQDGWLPVKVKVSR
jgi:hypothetical protein